MMSTVRPLASFLTVIRFSKEAMSCAPREGTRKAKQRKNAKIRENKIFIIIAPTRVKGTVQVFKFKTCQISRRKQNVMKPEDVPGKSLKKLIQRPATAFA